MRQAVRWLAAVALTACLAAGCGSSGGSAKPSTTTAASATDASPVTTRDELKDQILADYRKANNAYYDAISIGDPNLPSIEATHTGQNLWSLRKYLTDLFAKGQRGKDGPHSRDTSRAVVQQVLEGKAIVQDCRIDDGVIVDSRTGAVIDADVVTKLLRFELSRVGEVWRVSSGVERSRWDGINGCAA